MFMNKNDFPISPYTQGWGEIGERNSEGCFLLTINKGKGLFLIVFLEVIFLNNPNELFVVPLVGGISCLF